MADIWHECARWLINCEVLPDDHRVTWENAEVIDLANTLRDGVLLCQLLNKLVPGCVDLKEISLRPQMSQFLCLKNIRAFIQTCQNVFDLKATDLFEPHMLFDYTDFGRVLHTLSLLSKSNKAQKKARGFPWQTKVHDYYNDDIYRNLEDLANEGKYAEFGDYDEKYITKNVQDDEDIYEDLCSFQRNHGIQIPVVPVAPVEKRDFCVKELVETEKNYIEALNMIVKHFIRPLKNVFKPEDSKIIFANIKELAEIHTGFHSELCKACTSNQFKISDCFMHWKEKFVIYGEYCSNLPVAQELLDDLCTKNEIINQSVLRAQIDANDGKFRLRDLLSVPMQRILKYHLLLKELIRNTLKGHEDQHGLEKALDAMLDLAQYINEVKRDTETLQIIRDIQMSITDLSMPENTELKDYGKLLKDGELKIRSHDDNRLKNRYIFVFDKVMLMCKSTRIMDKLLGGEQYSYKEALSLLEYKVENVNTVKTVNKEKWSHYWYLVHKQNKTAFTMYAKSDEVKKKWIEAIEKALESLSPPSLKYTTHPFMLHTFEKPTNCSACDKLLRGLFFQGYKCSTCETAVHKLCITIARSCGAPSLPPRPLLNLNCPDERIRDNFSPISNGPKSPQYKVRAIKKFCGEGNGARQLSFEVDDIIYVLKKVSGLWCEGRLQKNGDMGLFPIDHVDCMETKRASYEDPVSRDASLESLSPVSHIDGYVNFHLEEYQWYAGSMDRDTATAKLEKLPNGTFLVRSSPKQHGGYAISLNNNNKVKHMRIYTTEDGQLFYLSESKYFKSIVELVRWYEENTLLESFKQLDATLTIPYLKAVSMATTPSEPIGYAIAVYNFTGSTTNMLSLQKGDNIAILSKAGGEKGWWKGQIEERVGYFPLAYVSEIQN